MISVRSINACGGISRVAARKGKSAYDPAIYKRSIRPGVDICYTTGGGVNVLGQLDAPEDDMDADQKPYESSGPPV